VGCVCDKCLLHVLPEVQHVADRVGLIRNGSLVLVSTVDELRAHASTRIEVTFVEAPPRSAFEGVPGVRELDRAGRRVRFTLRGEADGLVKALAEEHTKRVAAQKKLHTAQVRPQKEFLRSIGVPDLSPEEVTERARRRSTAFS
jgi:ABC-type multidrug transport system ATPase subunit